MSTSEQEQEGIFSMISCLHLSLATHTGTNHSVLYNSLSTNKDYIIGRL